MKAAVFFSQEVQAEIVASIKQAEKKTSGEIRLFVEDRCTDDALDRAAFLFEKLEMNKTKLRNGVLFYLSFLDHKFAIIGDVGINAVVEKNFWENIKDAMKERFAQGELKEGLKQGIVMAGEALQKYFPGSRNNKNELPDHVEVA